MESLIVSSPTTARSSSAESSHPVFEWEVNHVTSSPHRPKANSKAESAVKITKGLFKKAQKSGKDPWLALLDERNTPLEGLETSPAQRLMSRRTRRQLPTATSLLYPKVVDRVQEKIKLKKQRAKAYYDRTAKVLPELEVGQEVKVAPLHKSQTWKTTTCLQQLSDRSYLVQRGKETVRRNREALKPVPQQTNLAEETTPETEDQTVTYAPNSAETADSPKEDATSPNKPMRTTPTVPSE